MQTEGKCPVCGGELDYDAGELQDDSFVYPVSCKSCDWTGQEWHTLQFSEQTPADQKSSQVRRPNVVLNVSGGVVQDVYVDDPDSIEVVLIDWDTEGCAVGENDSLVEVEAADGALANAVVYPTAPLDKMPADVKEAVEKALR
jgi:hypothetical protein